MRILGIDPGRIRHVFISHDHWDHNGGLASLLAAHVDPELHLLNSSSTETLSIARRLASKVSMAEGPTRLVPGCSSTGAMGDAIPEQSLVLNSALGPVVVTGCAHPGLPKILETASAISGRNIIAVLGGFHLHRDSDESVRDVIAQLQAHGVLYSGPCHCSGDKAISLFQEAYGDFFLDCTAGAILAVDKQGFKHLPCQ